MADEIQLNQFSFFNFDIPPRTLSEKKEPKTELWNYLTLKSLFNYVNPCHFSKSNINLRTNSNASRGYLAPFNFDNPSSNRFEIKLECSTISLRQRDHAKGFLLKLTI